jgi:carbonic anhydrase
LRTQALENQQSPIDIVHPVQAKLGDLALAYQPTTLRILNDGLTVQVNHAPGSRLTIRDRTYEVVQFHFHTPAEHTVGGRAYPMEMHVVHQDAQGQLAVLGVFFELGGANEALEPIWVALPPRIAAETMIPGVTVDIRRLLPVSMVHFEYVGSRTMPPYTDDVRWLVLREPVSVSEEQVVRFRQIFPMNARPVQPLLP